MGYYEFFRVLNALLGVAILVVMALKYRTFVKNRTPIRMVGTGLGVIIIASTYGTIELWLQGADGSPRIMFSTVGLILVLLGATWDETAPVRRWWGNRKTTKG